MIDAAKAQGDRPGAGRRAAPTSSWPTAARSPERIAKKGPLAVARPSEVIDRGADLELADGLRIERQVFSDLFGSADQREGMKAFLEKRPPVFTGR